MQLQKHIVQSPEWAEFKTAYGTKVIKCGKLVYSKHHLPLSPYFVAYCPKVNPQVIDWDQLTKSLKNENCVSINFDVPNVIKETEEEKVAIGIFNARCQKSTRETFAGNTVLMDLTKSEDELLANMHPKHRYNLRLAQKHGVKIENVADQTGFDEFFDLLHATSLRQKYYIHPKHYYQKAWEILSAKNSCYILTAKHGGEALSSWMLFTYQGVLYYPYGGSSDKLQNFFPSNLLGWEAIKLGKSLGCHTFDMWGAAKNPNDQADPWWGFTNFKLKFGGRLVKFMDSYDYVVNYKVYKMFNLANDIRWKILKLIR